MSPFELSNNNKKSLLAMMYSVLKGDSIQHSKEWKLLHHVADEINIDIEELDSVVNLDIPKKEADRMAMFYYCFFMIKVDNIIDPDEVNLIQEYCLRLGFSPLMCDDFIQLARKYGDKKVPVEEMLFTIKKYLN